MSHSKGHSHQGGDNKNVFLDARSTKNNNNNDKYPEERLNTTMNCQINASDQEDPRRLIPQLCNHFYHLGWASGTGGGLSIRRDGKIYCAPSGVQKERIQPDDMFVIDEESGQYLEQPKDPRLKCSECLSLFMVAFKIRNAGCCIHSHSVYANLVTALHSDRSANGLCTKEFRIKNQEMIKGIKRGSTGENLRYNETLVVPIIDNVLYEKDLAGAMQQAVVDYPMANAVLVRNHGVYVWGDSWQQAKSMAECYDYLFKLKLEAHKLGFGWIVSCDDDDDDSIKVDNK